MGMAAGGGDGGAKADINMTPLIDVLLVLLIIFMIITNEPPRGLESLVPQPPPPDMPPPDPNENRTVVIQIAADQSLKINEEPTDLNRMGPRLEEIFKTRAERVVFVKGDPSLEYRYVAAAIDIAKGAGIDKVGLMTPGVESGE
ncbi:MAG: biopolymer transporter ExbD [Bryobacterales bacterium]|jgi:biopolymer transport protein ExbD|nr:biopolymer transporter ExbD [Bryobacterales bacterium]